MEIWKIGKTYKEIWFSFHLTDYHIDSTKGYYNTSLMRYSSVQVLRRNSMWCDRKLCKRYNYHYALIKILYTHFPEIKICQRIIYQYENQLNYNIVLQDIFQFLKTACVHKNAPALAHCPAQKMNLIGNRIINLDSRYFWLWVLFYVLTDVYT